MSSPPPRSDLAPWISRELTLRIVSSVVLAPLAIAIAWYGGWPFVVFWGLAGLATLWEWTALVAPQERRSVLSAGVGALLLALALSVSGRTDRAVFLVVMGALAAAAFAPSGRRGWVAVGILYAGVMALAPIHLRSDAILGFVAIAFVFAVVWATDIGAYVAGRLIGGPKLMPTVSPNKTWSGALGGLALAIACALGVAKLAGLSGWTSLGVVALVLSIVAQAGDLFESSLKRRFGAKDSGHLIPGHGGVMDRLDGFVAAVLLALLIALFRGGYDAPAQGLLVW